MAKNQVTINKNFNLGGKSFAQTTVIQGEVANAISVDLAAAKTGTLTTRTDNSTGTLTMTAGHGITTAARLDIYWSGGSRRGVLVGTVATNSVPFTVGAGDNLPIATTAITAMVPTKRKVSLLGDDIKLLAGVSPAGVKAIFVVVDGSDAELYKILAQGGVINEWHPELLPTNPLAGATIANVFISHGNSTATRNLILGYVAN